MSTTQRQTMWDALVARGCIPVQTHKKYWTLRATTIGADQTKFYFLGPNGSLRWGGSKSTSIPCERLKRHLLAPKVDLTEGDLGL